MRISSSLRDQIRGFILEQDGQVVGSALLRRKGSSTTWEIGNVTVLPENRRQGIGHELILASLALIRARGGRLARPEVVRGNLPARRLY